MYILGISIFAATFLVLQSDTDERYLSTVLYAFEEYPL